MFDNKGYFENTQNLIIDHQFNPINNNFFEDNRLEDLISNSNLVIFNYQENIPNEILLIIDSLVSRGYRIFVLTFCITLKNYFDRKYPNHNCEFPNIFSANNYHYTPTNYDFILNPNTFERKYDLKYFNATRKPFRDKTTKFLIDNNLLTDNNLISIRYNTTFDDETWNLYYQEYKDENSFLDIDVNEFKNFKHIHQSQIDVAPWGDQRRMDYKLYKAHLESMFNIITEASYPYDGSEHEILRNISSVSKRTVYPLLFKNIFHIYPQNKPLEIWLKENNFKLFFKNNDDFLENMNREFYYKKENQEKLEHNAKQMRSFFLQSAYDSLNELNN